MTVPVKPAAGTNDTIPVTTSTENRPSAVTRVVAEQFGATSVGKHNLTEEATKVELVPIAVESLARTFKN